MNLKNIRYEGHIEGLIFNGVIEVNTKYININKIELSQDEKRETIITFYLNSNIVEKKEAIEFTRIPLDDILNNIAFNIDSAAIRGFEYPMANYENSEDIYCKVKVRRLNQEDILLDSMIKFEDGNKYLDVKYKLFRTAMASKDPVTKFMTLFGIVYMKCHTELKIEELIENVKYEIGLNVNKVKNMNPHTNGEKGPKDISRKKDEVSEFIACRDALTHMDEKIESNDLHKLYSDIERILPELIKFTKHVLKNER